MSGSRDKQNNFPDAQKAKSKNKRSPLTQSQSSKPKEMSYDELFPPLPSSTPQNSSPIKFEVFNQPQSLPRQDPSPLATGKRSRQPKSSTLLSFVIDPTARNVTTVETTSGTRRRSEDRAPASPRSKHEEEVHGKLCEIILTIHLRKEFVSVHRVEKELFKFYGVESFSELGVDRRNLDALLNLIHYNKDSTFYMQVFEQVFNLCTLQDLGPLIAKFLGVETYDDARLGPLDQHPEVKRVFRYRPNQLQQPMPAITSGDVINAFLEFQESNRRGRHFKYEDFLDDLVEKYELQRHDELGVYCKSFPYLTEVTRKLSRDYTKYKKDVEINARQRMIDLFETKLWEKRQEVETEFEQTSYATKSPIAVFDHLIAIVEKHLTVPEQKTIRDTLKKLRDDQLLRCLFNISICLGATHEPEKFAAELQRIYQLQMGGSKRVDPVMASASTPMLKGAPPSKGHPSSFGRNNTDTLRTTVDTAFDSSSSFSSNEMPKVSLNQLCSDVSKILERYDTVLTIKQLYEVEQRLCSQHSVKRFSDFGVLGGDDDHPLDLISFLYAYRDKINPKGELSAYENASSSSDRQEMYAFVNQLSVLTDRREGGGQGENVDSKREIHFTKEQVSAVEKAVKHKFGGLLGFNQSSQILNKAKQHSRTIPTPIHYEESLLDVMALNRLGLSPTSLLIDENQLCQIILQCPVMINLVTWLQWSHFFQTKFGALRTFLVRHQYELQDLLLLETSKDELLRLPSDFSLQKFEKELETKNIRSAVGHLCALITREYVQVNRLPLTIYRQAMKTWFVRLQSSGQLHADPSEPMKFALEFLTYLPVLIGRTKIIEELVLDVLDDVLNENQNRETINPRQIIWNLANAQQRSKLELWAYTHEIDEWKNEQKWKGIAKPVEHSRALPEQPRKPIVAEKIPAATVPAEKPLMSTITSTPKAEVRHPTLSIIKANVDENAPVNAAYEHIKHIRERFGVDSNLDPTSQSIVSNYQGLLERSLEKLSKDLFSEQAHFVLELIQNADDNQYAAGCWPTLRFVLSSDRILVCNNELGFQAENITAICNVGGSTKGKHKQGYVGHKGIGFKSVFMVSDRPEIHSNDYHFCFDTVNGTEQIGYIRPIWLDEYAEELPATDQWNTCIRLPIKQEKRNDRLKRNFEDIQSRLLLFLNRLRQIEIIRQQGTTEQSRIFTRIDHADGQIIELQEKQSDSDQLIQNYWLVVKEDIAVPPDLKFKLSDGKGEVESTTIAVAYPLNAIHESSSYQILPTQPLFAYLPLRSYGFRFILQGDFEVPATRQDVFHDNHWNDWLKNEMVQLLPRAYERFEKLPELLQSCSLNIQSNSSSLTTMQTLKYFLKLIPTHNELDPYFNTFIDNSVRLLKGLIRLPVISNEKNDTIDWVSPTQCVLVRDPFIREMFSPELLFSHFNRYYLDEQIIRECDEVTLLKLGCHRLDFSAILRLIRTLYTQNDQEYSTQTTSIEQIAQWFLCIEYSLQQQRENPGFNFGDDGESEMTSMDELRRMKIIPLRGQSRLVSIAEYDQRAILFPLDKKASFGRSLRIVFEDTPMIDERLLNLIEQKYPRRFESIKRLLRELGLTEALNLRRIYSNHILPVMMDDAQWSTKSDAVLIAYLICIFEGIYAVESGAFSSEMDKLKNQMIVKTHQGKFIRLNSTEKKIVHLPSSYGFKHALNTLKSLQDQLIFISDDYLKEYRNEIFMKDSQRNRFIYFLNDLGIHDFFQINVIDRPFSNVESLAGTQWAPEIGSLSASLFEPFIITDYRSEEFEQFISTNDINDAVRYTEILSYLDQCFDSTNHYYAAKVETARSRHTGNSMPIKAVESSFSSSLRQYPWIPVGSLLFRLTDVYLLPPNQPFSRYVPHLDRSKVALKNGNFIRFLGFKQEITPMTMFELFMKWSCDLDRDSWQALIGSSSEQPSKPIPYVKTTAPRRSCRDTIVNFRQIYMFLASNPETCTLLVQFRLWPLIFIPQTADTGQFFCSDEVLWFDPEMLLTTNNSLVQKYSLQPYYDTEPRFQQFFIKILGILREPTLDDYLPLLSDVTDQTNEYIWKCIDVITRLAFIQNKQKLVKDRCLDWSFIPCLNNTDKFCKYTEKLYYPHDMSIASLFADILPIVKPPEVLLRSSEFKQRFCSLFEVSDLADVIKVSISVDNEELSKELHHFYTAGIQLIQQFLMTKNLLSELRSSYLQSIFSRLIFVSVEQIHLSYRYQEEHVRTSISPSNLHSVMDESVAKFYVLKKYEKSSHHINTMVNFLVSDESVKEEVMDFIRNLFTIYLDEGIKGLAQYRDRLPPPTPSTWIIHGGVKTKLVETVNEEQDSDNHENPEIPPELLEEMKKKPGWRLNKPAQQTPIDPNQPKSLTSLPATAGIDKDAEPPSRSPGEVVSNTQAVVQSTSNRTTNNTTDSNNVAANEQSKSNRDNTSADGSAKLPSTTAPLTEFVVPKPTRANFENIRVSTLKNFNVSPVVSSDLPITPALPGIGTNVDREIGRQGEKFVYEYLRWKYPEKTIEWINREQESGQPFDIRIKGSGSNDPIDLIEVKTTRSSNQNTFQISINEVECLLDNLNHYHIYRVYYVDDQSSTITILSRLKLHLQQRHLALSMTILEETDA